MKTTNPKPAAASITHSRIDSLLRMPNVQLMFSFCASQEQKEYEKLSARA
jgi:hypothetical protein